ncbi:MAG TPA: hypothetical protein DCZ92_07685 [Elusimicrobia bacterium]|nr:hypothetical protein [Elusimicrobiota bacterium]
MISDERLLDFSRSLSAAVRSGLALSDAFETLAKSSAHGGLIAAAAKMTARGTTIHEALAALKIFPPVFIALVRAGEEGGKTDEFLDLYSGCLEVRIEFRRRIRRALVYPAFVALLAAALFLALTLKAIPMIVGPLAQAGAAMPPQAAWLTSAAAYLQANWPQVLLGALACFLILRWLLRSGPARKARALACRLLPGFRYATSEARLYNVYTTMSLLMKAGLPPSAMLDVLLQFSEDDLLLRRRLRRAEAMLAGGVTFTGSFDGFIPKEDFAAMEIAEKTGRLEETLLRLGKTHYDLHLHRLKLLSTFFTIATTAALAPLCFLLILSLIKPVLSAVGAVTGLPGSDAGAAAPSPAAQPAAPPRILDTRTEYEAERDRATADFNAVQAAKLAGFMKERGVAKDAGSAGPEEKADADNTARPGETAAPKKKKLGPVPQIKKIQLKGFGSTTVQPTEVNSTQ